ncbi:hypothetical protein MTR67_019293 [Solanum verrucosum]|uniref:Uroporphyrinogen-III synthase n=1 Tax=Solanum verrucosum TaxID=315347 RepID=A0AAF0QPA8_SOLVR|nr:hypothetical protein MTR67_019293 [Solanum verrucosum]
MRWHKETYLDETNVLRHPVDSEAWKEFDKNHTWLAQEPRNIRLGLATDGFNPFGNMSTNYSMWPVILFSYNLPPWKCFTNLFMMMSLLIPGPQAPGKDIDVYLRPLVDELKELWSDGVETFDAFTGECFKMHAAVLWTINDFPAYANLSGWSTKGYMACPTCNKDALSQKVKSKICYMDHRRYLKPSHAWRRSMKFDGKVEKRLKPKELSGDDVLQQLDLLNTYRPGKHSNNKKKKRLPIELNWMRKSIFFELPYWKSLKLRHNLDVMHIEKNICENILGTLLNIDRKTKDTEKAREDLKDMNIRKELWLQHDDSSYTKPPACYNMSEKEKREFGEFLKCVKFPDGYASNISRCVSADGVKLAKLKSHDYHVLLQRLLPIAIRGFGNKDVSLALIELGHFFQRLCCKTLKRDDLDQLERDIVIILCKLEMIFPPAFFDIMVHLAVHLPREAMYGGPVQYRWMYKIERFLCKLKRYVRNKARPEGSIAEGYIIDECLTFCSMCLTNIETRFNREDQNADGSSNKEEHVLDIFSKSVRPFKGEYDAIPKKDFDMAQWEHKNELLNQDVVNIEDKHREHFSLWFKGKIMHLCNKENSMSIKKLYPLAMGPDVRGRRYPGCIVNGVRYHIQSRDELRKSQNSGIVFEGYHENEEIDFYGIIVDIIELEYIEGNRVVLFKCKWFDLRKKTGMQKDKNFTSINVNRFWYEHDSFVLATQAKQVFYICDPKLGKNWRIVQKFQDRHIYDVLEMQNSKVESDELHIIDEVYQDVSMESNMIDVSIEDMPIQLHRDDVDSITLDSSAYELKVQTEHEVGYNTEDFDLEDDSIIEYISNLDRTEGTTRAYLSLTTTSASLLLLPASIFDEAVQSSKQYLDVAFAPSKATGKVLALELPKNGNDKCTVLYPASAKASTDIGIYSFYREEGLSGRGFEVTRLNTYTTAPVNHVDQYLLELALSALVVAIASPSALRVWANLTASRQWDNVVACIGETTTSAAKKLGFRNIYYPTSPGLEGVYWEQSLYLHKVVVRLRAHHPPRPHLWEYTRYPGSASCTSLIQLSTPESVVSAELRTPGQGFAWGQKWSPGAGPAQGVGSGLDINWGKDHMLICSLTHGSITSPADSFRDLVRYLGGRDYILVSTFRYVFVSYA